MADQNLIIQSDGPNKRWVLKVLKDDGTPNTAFPDVAIALDDCYSGAAVAKSLKVREWDVCQDNGDGTFTAKKALFLSSEAY